MEMAAAAWAVVKTAISYVAQAGVSAGVSAGLSKGAAIAVTNFAIKAAGVAALSAASAALMKPNLPERAPGEWVADPNAGIPFAIGERIGVAGNVVYKNTYGKDNEYKGIVTVLSGAGPIGAYLAFTADREAVTFDGGGAAVGRYAGGMWMDRRMGDQPDTALTFPTFGSYTFPSWGTGHKLSGKACFGWTLKQDSKFSTYPQGEPAPIHVIEGIPGYDPRLDDTFPGGSGAVRLNDRSTWPTITNPIIADLNWVLGLRENDKVVGGCGASVDAIDWDAYIEAANVADANGWTICAYPRTTDQKAEVRRGLLQAGGALLSRRAGLYSCVTRGAVKASVATITVGDTAGPIEIETCANVLNRLNTLTPRYVSEDHEWTMVAAAPVTSSVYVIEDRGNTRSDSRDYPYVSSAEQAAHLAALDIANSREGIAGTIPLKPWCRDIRPGDAFVIDGPGFVADNLKCLCLQRDYDPGSDIVRVTFVSETDGKIAWALGQAASPPPTPALSSREDLTAPDPAAWAVSVRAPSGSGAQVPVLDVTGAIDNDRADQIVVVTGPSDTGPWEPVEVADPNATSIAVKGLQPGDAPWVGVMYRSVLEGPSDVTVLDQVTVPDLVVSDDSITTAKVVTGAINQFTSTYTDGNADISAGLGWVTVATIVVTTIADETVDLDGEFNFSVDNALTATMGIQTAWFKDGVQMAVQSNVGSIEIGAGDHYLPNGKNGSKVNDTPGPGTFTYTLRAQASGTEYAGVASRRYGRALTLKKPG